MAGYKPTQRIKTADTLFGVLELLSDRGRMRVTDVAEEMNMAKSTIYDHLNTLEEKGFVVKEDNEYRLGLKFLGYGAASRRVDPVASVVHRPLERIATAHGESAWYVVAEHDYALFASEALGEEAIDATGRLGTRLPLSGPSVAESALSCLSVRSTASVASSGAAASVRDGETGSVAAVAQRSADGTTDAPTDYALGSDPLLSGAKALAVPVTVDEVVHGVICVSGPEKRIDRKVEREGLAELAVEVASELEVESQVRSR